MRVGALPPEPVRGGDCSLKMRPPGARRYPLEDAVAVEQARGRRRDRGVLLVNEMSVEPNLHGTSEGAQV
jgi:hypothetical protein